jgi:hypothetical protein
MICPLCSHKFTEYQQPCAKCVLHKSACGLVCCPNCGYEFPERSITVDFFKKIFGKREKNG